MGYLAFSSRKSSRHFPAIGITEVIAYNERIVDRRPRYGVVKPLSAFQAANGPISYGAYIRYMSGEYLCVETSDNKIRLLPSSRARPVEEGDIILLEMSCSLEDHETKEQIENDIKFIKVNLEKRIIH